ncbi:Macrolide export ATP-binding/permease protein MacB [Paenibacillus sp. CECT 9249]|uniref:ABC transporter permease n=1 Tax=Paenibacillus sp. CECT 9249 TaxID=2845385 RepID=UPI001E4C79C7|nr:ABC transporter permease [Paenibacillus sp. CECT 9249]CAH0121591.1 Macrolide export ATP-binding/permease protein MacB [Paenibacillus sp. CECT 9249]
MHIGQGIKMAWKAILANKLRTLLTMLGIVIGVASVITLVAMGKGTQQNVKDQMASLGTNLLAVNISGRGAVSSLTVEEAEALGVIDAVTGVAPIVNGNAQVKFGANNVNVSTEGVTASYEEVRDVRVQSGRFINAIDVRYRQKVALIGTGTAGELFGTDNPVGQYVSINGARFKVVGLLEEQGTSLGGSNDDKILIPISTAERLLRSSGVRSVYMQTGSENDLAAVQAEVEKILAKKFRGNTNGYNVFNQADMVKTISEVSSTLAKTLAGIASISLLVGGIGIMNIMLVSVTERTREIGIRKSIGAKRKDILLQFLLEALVISGLSGVFGVAVSYSAVYFLNRAGTMALMTWDTIAMSFLFSFAIGISFGIFPANKASKLRPVDALRYD